MRRSSKAWMPHPVVGLLACLAATALPAVAEPATPSFDCRNAGTASERLVCSSDELAALDRRLGEAFNMLRLSAADDRKAALSKDQQRWLREVRDGCVATLGKQPVGPARLAALSCLSARYRVRLNCPRSRTAGPGPLPMIRLLLRAGADPYQADSKDRRAIDYLLGFGPTAANPTLTPAEREEAVRLLY